MFFLRIAETLLANQEAAIEAAEQQQRKHKQNRLLATAKRRLSDTEDELSTSRSNSVSPAASSVATTPVQFPESELSKALDSESPPKAAAPPGLSHSLLYHLLVARDENNNSSSSQRFAKCHPTELSKLLSREVSDGHSKPALASVRPPAPAKPHRKASWNGPQSKMPRLEPRKESRKSSMAQFQFNVPNVPAQASFSATQTRSIPAAKATANAKQPQPPPQQQHHGSILSALISAGTNEFSPVDSADSGLDEPIDLLNLQLPNNQAGSILGKQLLMNFCANTVTSFASPSLQTVVMNALNGSGRMERPKPPVFVQLAKKNAQPVQARVSDWLRQAAIFVATTRDNMPEAGSEDWLSLLRCTWHRLLATYMAEYALDAVIVDSDGPGQQVWNRDLNSGPSIASVIMGDAVGRDAQPPTRAFADQILAALRELSQAGLTSDEFCLLRHAVLLTAKEPKSLSSVGCNLVKAVWMIRNHRIGVQGVSKASEDRMTALQTGLTLLSSLCPAQMASLFCQHLHKDSAESEVFLAELNRSSGGSGPSHLHPSPPPLPTLPPVLQLPSTTAQLPLLVSPAAPVSLDTGQKASILSSVLAADDDQRAAFRAQHASKLVTSSAPLRGDPAAMATGTGGQPQGKPRILPKIQPKPLF